jgi:hypothetical protein
MHIQSGGEQSHQDAHNSCALASLLYVYVGKQTPAIHLIVFLT